MTDGVAGSMTGRRRGRRWSVVVATMATVASVGLLAAACNSSGSNGGGGGGGGQAAPTTTPGGPNAIGALVAGPPDGPIAEGGKISYGIDAEPEGLDPTRYAFSQAGHAVASAVFDPLATLDENGNATPYLATGFDHNADSTEWTIGLPAGVKFHDGTPLNADALLANFEAYKASAITGPPWKSVVVSSAKKDDTHVVVSLNKPYLNFPQLLTTQIGYVIAPVMINDPTMVKRPVGSGPFVFVDHQDGKVWSFKKNPNYRDKKLPHLDAIDFKPIADHAERNAQLRSGDLDVIQTDGGPQILELRNSDFKRVENQHGDKAFLTLNTSKPPFDNLTARRAVAFATDSAKWRKDILADVAVPANSPYGLGQPGYLQDNGFPSFDLDKAKQLVKQYEQEMGKPLEFTIITADDVTNASVGQTFATTYEQAGMKVKVQQLPQINLLAQVATGAYELSQFRLYGSPNPDTETPFYMSSTINPGVSINFARYGNPDIDSAVSTALGSSDPKVRAQSYEKVSRIFGEQVPYVWLGQETWMVAANKKVNGLSGALNGSIPTVGPKTWIAGLSLSA